MWWHRVSAAIWQMRSTLASSTQNQADPNGSIIFQIWCRNSKVGLSRAWLSLFTQLVLVSYGHISSLPDTSSLWWMLLTSSGTQTQIISIVSNDTWYRTAVYWWETEWGTFYLKWLSCSFPFFRGLWSVQYWTEPPTSLMNVHKPATQVKVILGASCP